MDIFLNPQNKYYRVWAEVDLDAVRSNIEALKTRLKPTTKICIVIKADGYGHGAVPVAKYCEDLYDFMAVATLDEALDLRANGLNKPVLVLGYTHPARAREAADNDIRLAVFDDSDVKEMNSALEGCDKKLKVHVALDTGMSRIGYLPPDIIKSVKDTILKQPDLELEGIFSHLYGSDSDDLDSARGQFDVFKTAADGIKTITYLRIPIRHIANSAAVTNIKNFDQDMVRLGISIYGLYPSQYTKKVRLTPAMTLKSHIILTKWMHPGTTVGYGATFECKRETNIATIPVGYADGYMRTLSNKGYVLIRGHKAPVIGRVCMDMIMVDVTDIKEAAKGDEVVLVGAQGDERITMEEIADLAGSFNYEFACDINKRVPRIYFAGGKPVDVIDYYN